MCGFFVAQARLKEREQALDTHQHFAQRRAFINTERGSFEPVANGCPNTRRFGTVVFCDALQDCFPFGSDNTRHTRYLGRQLSTGKQPNRAYRMGQKL
ncbi:hypothetical protein D3C85_1432520 [compost metagenome]